MSDELREVPCPSCNSAERIPLAVIKLSPVRIESTLVRCVDCGLAFVSPRPTEEFEKNFYATQHYKLEDENSWRENRLPFFKWALDQMEARATGRRLLDVGCGGGFFLDLARSRGWEVKGTEISEDGIQRAKQMNLDVFQGRLAEANYKANSFSVITLWNVLDQMMEPKKETETIFHLLEPGGLLALRVSNLAFHLTMHHLWNGARKTPLAGWLREKPTVFHLQMFDRSSLVNFFQQAGFKEVLVKNSILDAKNEVLKGLFGKSGAQAAAFAAYLMAELARGLSGGLWVSGPSLFVLARKPYE